MKFGILFNTQSPPDGERTPQRYQEILEEAVLAEQVGFHRFIAPEHHMFADGYLPQPLVMLAAIAARTSTIRLGTGIMHLTQRDPIHVAEEVNVLDNISGGRVDLGVGLNLTKADYDLFQLPMKNTGARLEEQLEILRGVWTTWPFSYQGQFFSYDNVSITPKPVQRDPHPPIWIGSMSEPSLKRAGRMGFGWVTDPLHNIHTMKKWADIFRGAAEEAGVKPGPIILKRDTWVSKSEREIRDVWWPTMYNRHMEIKGVGIFGAGRFNTDWEPDILDITDEQWTFDRMAPDRLIAGSPDQVVEQIGRYTELLGTDEIVFSMRQRTGPDHAATMRAIELMGTDVIPQFA